MIDFDLDVIVASAPFLWDGMLLSALMVAAGVTGGLIIGTGLALMRLSRNRAVAGIAAAYVELVRSIPLILVLFWFYFLVPVVIGRPVGALYSALTAFVLFEAAFYCEIIRGGILAVPRGQWHAARASGLGEIQVMRLVVLPQAVRAMTPILLSQGIILFQDTSLVYVVALRDFMTAASVVASRDGRPIEMYSLVALVYFAICFSASFGVDRLRKARAT